MGDFIIDIPHEISSNFSNVVSPPNEQTAIQSLRDKSAVS